MRRIFRFGLVLGATALAGPTVLSAQNSLGEYRGPMRLFVSPMGEPFRSEKDGPNPIDTWFNGVDANHDGALTLPEFSADGDRFFLILDRQHDGEIDPDDIEYYETVLVPEIRVGIGFGGYGAANFPVRPVPGFGSDGMGGGHGAGAVPVGDGAGVDVGAGAGEGQDDSPPTPRGPAYNSVKRGAAKYGFFDFPEPVAIADRNFNRGVSALEFREAARTRFNALDSNHDGKILRAELPDIEAPVVGQRSRRKRGR